MFLGEGIMISVIACTNRESYIKNIIDNFQKQTLSEKELILILNTKQMNVDRISMLLTESGVTFQLLEFSEEVTLGECLNKGGAVAFYNIVAKMDDDDYYGSEYLREGYEAFLQTNADVIGKSSFYIYFKRNHELRLYNPNHANCFVLNDGQTPYKSEHFLSGASLMFKKEILNTIPFPDYNIGEDSGFQRLCYQNGIKMFSTSSLNYAYIRYAEPYHHHSDAREMILKKRSLLISKTATPENIIGF
jgi:hypothetical protein